MENETSINQEAPISTVFERYEYKGWLITIENYRGTNKLIGFATPTKYSHLLKIYNYWCADEILQENGIATLDENGEFIEDVFIVAEPDDIVISFFAGIDTTRSASVLEYMVNEIIKVLGIAYPKIIVLKQVNKKAITPKVGKRRTGFLHVAWASLVKYRDKKCTECGSIYDLHAHHIKQYKSHPELRNDVNNGITLCGSCHRKWHSANGI